MNETFDAPFFPRANVLGQHAARRLRSLLSIIAIGHSSNFGF